jgi:hypothetical protein
MSEWTTAADLRVILERRWRSGAILKAYAAGESFAPISLPISRPRDLDLLERRDEVNTWLHRLTLECASTRGRPGLRIESTTVASRRVGRNELPRRLWIDSYAALFGWLGVTGEVAQLDALLSLTTAEVPELAHWAVAHPRVVLDHAELWPRLLATVAWIAAHDQHLFLRQVDVPGVDTKFIEQNRVILGRLLDQVLPARRIDARFSAGDFAARYGFRRRPDYTRIRTLGDQDVLPGGLSEVTVRTTELARIDPPVEQVIIVENDVSYLALPDRPGAMAIFGSGFALGSVAGLPWLASKTITYWGDIDTYGFVILNRLRARYPRVESILMDAETLLGHPEQWVVEEKPTDIALPHLTDAEAALYHDLVEGRFGHHVRLEQERISYARVLFALGAVSRGTTQRFHPKEIEAALVRVRSVNGR